MHGLVTDEDPRQRRGDLAEAREPTWFLKASVWWRPTTPCFKSWAAGGIGLRFFLHAGICPLSRCAPTSPKQAFFYALERSWVDKDPRLCITHSAYLHILLRRIPLVVAIREPLAVATSLHARNGFSLNRGLVLWWIYNHHVASQLCSEDLLISYSDLLAFDVQSLQQRLGPFLEQQKHSRPSESQARALITTLIRPELNRSDVTINGQISAFIHPQLLETCNNVYNKIAQSGFQLVSFKEHFDCLPRAVCDCLARESFSPETDFGLLHKRLHSLESETQSLAILLEQRQRECVSLQHQITSLLRSRSWKITAPFRSL